jgi:hypothetical protein
MQRGVALIIVSTNRNNAPPRLSVLYSKFQGGCTSIYDYVFQVLLMVCQA